MFPLKWLVIGQQVLLGRDFSETGIQSLEKVEKSNLLSHHLNDNILNACHGIFAKWNMEI